MAELKLYLFGAPRIEREGRLLPLRRSRALALLAYLALTGQPQERERLLALLWPEFDTASARNNLRRELSLLRTTLGEGVLRIDRAQVAWHAHADVWVDVVGFQAGLAAGPALPDDAALSAPVVVALDAAVQLAGDEFMAGFSLPDCPAFEEWQFFQREELRQQLARVLPALSGWQISQGDYSRALGYARRWLALDPLHEPAQRELMRSYALAGQYAAALRQYEECARLLATELGAEPDAETQALFAAIKTRRIEPVVTGSLPPVPQEPSAALSSSPRRPLNNLPPPFSGFVGRESELADLIRRLTDPDCRLLTLVGPGGIGKTQLALRAARRLAEGWADDAVLADGVLYVPLVAVSSLDEIVTALAGAAGFAFYPGIPPRQQLIDFLRTRRMLILLDNFEHLRDAAGFIAELLAAAPGLRMLVTSREALNLQEEWFHPLGGLTMPDEDAAHAPVARLARYDAIRVFEQHARRFQGSFSLSRDRAQVVRLCRLVAGMPLAIELATTWLKVLTVDQIVAALERDLDILTARSRDLPVRHRNMRIVLEETWRLLADDEQYVLAGLCVFSGSFTVAAAQAVVGVTLPLLAGLVERSLLRTAGEGRFHLHELLRQFATEQLNTDPRRAQAIHAQHSTFYLAALAEQREQLAGPTLQAAVAILAQEAENIRTAWQWACANGKVAGLDAVIHAYATFLLTRSAFQEGRERFEEALSAAERAVDTTDPRLREQFLARAYIRWGMFCHYPGDHATSARAIEHGLIYAQRYNLQHEIALARLIQGVASGAQGDVASARRQLHEALALGRAGRETAIIANSLYELANLAGHYGDVAEGKRLAQESVAVSREAGQLDRTAYALIQLAWLRACHGEYDAAEACWREALVLFERVGSQYGIALATGGTGYVAWCRGGEHLPEAQRQTLRSLELLRTINHRLSIASRLSDLALIALDRGDEHQAELYSQEGLALARQVNSTVFTASHLSILGHIASIRGEFVQSRHYLNEALTMTTASGLLPRMAFTCYHIALLAVHEAAALGADSPPAIARRSGALALFTAISSHPAATHLYQVRACACGEQLRHKLPPALAEAAIRRGRQLDLRTGGAELLAQGLSF